MKTTQSSWTLGGKITAAMLLLVTTLVATLVMFVSSSASAILRESAVKAMASEAAAVRNMTEMFNRSALVSVERFYKTFASDFPDEFFLDSSREFDAGGVTTGVLMNGTNELNLNFAMVDGFSVKTGATATIFARKADDFVRIATSVKKENGQRAVGSMLDRKHAAYPLLMSGQGYKGVATLFGKQFVTEYQPIKNAAGAVIGVLYVGVDMSAEVTTLKEKIKALKIGESGFFYILNAKQGDDYGMMLMHPTQQGKKALESKDADGVEFVKNMLETKEGILRYRPTDTEATGKKAEQAIAVFTSYPNWNWTIVGTVPEAEITGEIANLRNISLLAALFALALFAAVLYVFVHRTITKPLAEAKDAASHLAKGDLTARVVIRSNDEIGDMARAINGIGEGLAKSVRSIRVSADSIASASSQIASGNMDLSSRTEQQASSLEETASSMEELTSTVKQNADNARQANQLAVSASGVAVKGGGVVSQVVTTMESINDSARKIVDIIGVIDGIAFQTNILALNAAVEAARAGEQGRGFAVVASEVRNLAQRSAAAAKEIKTLISDSVEKVDAGSKLVGVAGSTMEEIVDSVKRVTDVMAEIMAASQEQSAGIEQVNQAIGQMDQVTQQNAALVEEAAAAAESLQEQSANLAQVVSVFKLDGIQAASTTVRAGKTPTTLAVTAKALAVGRGKASASENAFAVAAKRPRSETSLNKEWEEF